MYLHMGYKSMFYIIICKASQSHTIRIVTKSKNIFGVILLLYCSKYKLLLQVKDVCVDSQVQYRNILYRNECALIYTLIKF